MIRHSQGRIIKNITKIFYFFVFAIAVYLLYIVLNNYSIPNIEFTVLIMIEISGAVVLQLTNSIDKVSLT